jgi:hypothetical protein
MISLMFPLKADKKSVPAKGRSGETDAKVENGR